jgi:hypothetical protein
MNCERFADQWSAHVAGLLTPPDEVGMLEHSRGCDACGTKWREHEELSVLLGNVIHPLKPAEGRSSRLVDRLPPARHGAALAGPRRETLGPAGTPMWPLVLLAFLGGVVLSSMSGLGQNSSTMEQLFYAEMMGRGGGMRGFGAMGLTARANDVFSMLFTLAFLTWITRASFWSVLFPIRMPWGVVIARFLAIPVIMLGMFRLLIAVLVVALSWTSNMNQGFGDFSPVILASEFLGQLWMFAFWIVLLVLLFGVLNEIARRHARPLQ